MLRIHLQQSKNRQFLGIWSGPQTPCLLGPQTILAYGPHTPKYGAEAYTVAYVTRPPSGSWRDRLSQPKSVRHTFSQTWLTLHGITHIILYFTTVDLVIFAYSNFRGFLILRLFTKFRIREFSFFFSSAIIKIIFTRFLNSPIVLLAKFAKIKTSLILPDLQ